MAGTATVGILRILLSASTAEFEAGMKKSSSAATNFFKELKASGNEAEKVGAALTNAFKGAEAGTAGLGKAISGLVGLDVIQQANTYAKAVESIGGASKLTAAEQQKVNASVTQAIEKYQVIGREAPEALKALQKATTPLVDSNKAWVDQLNKVGDQATQAGMTLTKALTVPIVAIGGLSAKAAIDFESSFAGIRKTVDGVVDSSGNLTKAGVEMQQSMRNLAKEIPVSVTELNKIGESAGALGIAKENIVDFTSVMAKLGVTTNLTSEEAANSIAKIQNIFGAAGVETENFASTLVALGNAGASTEKEIVSMAARIAGAGHTVGITQGQVLAFASTLASVGIEAEAGGSAISRIFLRMNDAVAKGGKALAEFARVAGMSAAEFKKAFQEDAALATQKFIEGLGRLKGAGENINATIEGLVGKNIILKDTLFRLSGAGDLLAKNLDLQNTAWKENSALTKEAEQRFRTTEQQLALLWNRITDVGITIGNALLPAIRGAIDAVNVFLPLVEGLALGFANMPAGIQLAIFGFFGLVAAIGPALVIFGQMAKGTADLIAMFGKGGLAATLFSTRVAAVGAAGEVAAVGMGAGGFAGALAFLTNPITLTIAALALLAGGIYLVATAESDLDKELKDGSEGFRKHTETIDDALKTYDELRGKQNLTGEETRKLETATRQLAEASGLSKEAFEKEAAGSDKVTGALRQQLTARRELMSEAVRQAREAAAQIEAEINRAQAQLAKVLSGEAQIAETTAGTAGGGGVMIRGLRADERIKEIKRLSGEIEDLQKKAGAARSEVEKLVGPLSAAQQAFLATTIPMAGAAKKVVDQFGPLTDAARQAATAGANLQTGWQGVAGIFVNGVVPALGKTGAAAKATGADVSKLAELNAQYVEDMKKIGARVNEILPLYKEHGRTVTELAKDFDVSESTIKHYLATVKESGKAHKEAAKEAKESTDFLFKFNKGVQDLTNTMTRLDEAQEKLWEKTVKAALQDLDDESRKIVAAWMKIGEESGKKFTEGLAKSNKAWIDAANDRTRAHIELEKDSLDKRQALIRHDFDVRRSLLKANTKATAEDFEILNAQERAALDESEKQWTQSQQNKADATIEALAGAFAKLAEISGGSFGDVVQDIGEVIAALSLASKASGGLEDAFKTIGSAFDEGFDFSTMLEGIGQLTTASMAAIAAIASATDPSRRTTRQTTLGGAAVGARIGATPALAAATGGLSIAVGAGVGALVGWWRGSHAEWKKVAKDIGKDIGQDISDGLAQEIAQMAKTLAGGTKQQRREWAELFSLDSIIAEAGGLTSKNIQKYEQQAMKLFEVIQRGGELGAQATEELNGLIAEFGAHAEKTGGMWDPVFKKLIADSKALGINLEAVTAAVDAQISKLAGGLATATKGAFTEADKLLKGLSKEQIAAIRSGDKGEIAKLGITPDQIKAVELAAGSAQGAFDRLSRTALASFNAIIASGRTAFQAIAEIGPTIDILIARHDELGLRGGAAFDQLARFRILTQQNAELVASVGGLNDVMVALSNLGGLNADVLADLEAQGLAAFEQLTAAGFTEQEALMQMAPLLESIIQAHRDLGIPIDENTQRLIDQAEAQGLLSEEAMSTNDILMEGFAALIEAVGGKLPEAFQKMRDAAKEAGEAGKKAGKDTKDSLDKIPRDIPINIEYRRGEMPPGMTLNPDGTFSFTPEPGGAHTMAHGGVVHASQGLAIGASMGRLLPFPGQPKGIDTVPIWAAPGEGVLNRLGMSTLGRADFESLNAGINPMRAAAVPPASLQRTGTEGGVTITNNNDFSGSYIDSEHTANALTDRVGKKLATQLRRDPTMRENWRQPIKSIVGSGL